MVDFGFYKTVYMGSSIPESDFLWFAARAEDRLRRYKRSYRVTVPAGEQDAEENAACAMADALYYFEQAAVRAMSGSVSVGSVSVGALQGSAPDLSPKAQERELYRCASEYLTIERWCG